MRGFGSIRFYYRKPFEEKFGVAYKFLEFEEKSDDTTQTPEDVHVPFNKVYQESDDADILDTGDVVAMELINPPEIPEDLNADVRTPKPQKTRSKNRSLSDPSIFFYDGYAANINKKERLVPRRKDSDEREIIKNRDAYEYYRAWLEAIHVTTVMAPAQNDVRADNPGF